MIIAVIWIIVRTGVWLIKKKVDWKYELKLLTVFAGIALVTRFVYFPLRCDILTERLFIYFTRDIENYITLKPFTFLKMRYSGWQYNVFGNILMFVPVGIFWPFCFKALDRIWKVVLAGAGYSLLIELSQLCVYGRNTDIDDLILNTFGAFVGALIYFCLIKKLADKKKSKTIENTTVEE